MPTRRLTSRDALRVDERLPTLSRVTNVDAMPARSRSRNSTIEVRAHRDDQRRAHLVGELEREVLADPAPRPSRSRGRARAGAPRRGASAGVRARPALRPCATRRPTRSRSPRRPRRRRARPRAARRRRRRPPPARVGSRGCTHHAQVGLVPGPRATTRACRSRNRVRSAGSWIPAVSVPASSWRWRRVLGERLERVRDAPLLLGERFRERALLEHRALRDECPVAPHLSAVEPDELALRDQLEERGARGVDQLDPGPHELERPGVREAAGARRRDVHHRPHAALGELRGRDPVDVRVVDDRDVVRPEPLDEVLVRRPSRARPVISLTAARPR